MRSRLIRGQRFLASLLRIPKTWSTRCLVAADTMVRPSGPIYCALRARAVREDDREGEGRGGRRGAARERGYTKRALISVQFSSVQFSY